MMGLNTFVALALLIAGADAQMTPYNFGETPPCNSCQSWCLIVGYYADNLT